MPAGDGEYSSRGKLCEVLQSVFVIQSAHSNYRGRFRRFWPTKPCGSLTEQARAGRAEKALRCDMIKSMKQWQLSSNNGHLSLMPKCVTAFSSRKNM